MKDTSGLIYGLIKKVNIMEKRLTELEEKKITYLNPYSGKIEEKLERLSSPEEKRKL